MDTNGKTSSQPAVRHTMLAHIWHLATVYLLPGSSSLDAVRTSDLRPGNPSRERGGWQDKMYVLVLSQVWRACSGLCHKFLDERRKQARPVVLDTEGEKVEQSLDTDVSKQKAQQGRLDDTKPGRWHVDPFPSHHAPMRDDAVKQTARALRAAVQTCDVRAFVRGIRDLAGITETMRLAVADHDILNAVLKHRSNTHLKLLHIILNFCSTRFNGLYCILATLSPVHAKETGSLNQNPDKQDTKGIDSVDSLLWTLCGFLVLLIPSVGMNLQIKNCTSVIYVTAFVTAVAMSVSANQDFPNLWGVLCAGTSIGSSLLLLRKTRTKTNRILITFARYVVPVPLVWQFLSAIESGGQGHRLDLSVSIPCLAILGSVSINALLNQWYRETQTFFRWLWRQWNTYPQLERSEDDLV